MKLKRVVMLIILILAIIGTTSYGTEIDFSPIETQEPEIEIPTLEKPDPEVDVPTKLEPTTNTTQDQSSTSHGGGGYNRGEQTTDNDGEGPGATSSIDFNYQDYQPGEQQGYDKVVDWAGSFLGILRNVGVIVGVVGIAIIGIKYMLGSVEQKAQYKQTLIPFAIGILMLVAGTVLVSVIYEVFA